MIRRRQASWTRWLMRRIQELRQLGFEIEIAQKIARAETTVRQRLGRQIGWKAARKARLTMIADGNNVRFALSGTSQGLTEEQRARLFRMPGLKPVIESHRLTGFHIL